MKQKYLFLTIGLCLMIALFGLKLAQAAPAPSAAPDAAPAQAACESLKDLKLPDVTIRVAQLVSRSVSTDTAGLVVYGPDWKSPPSAHGQASVPVNFCRIAATVPPSITFEVWMPLPEKWNGKFNGVGNGALAGGVNYPAMVAPLTQGYAVGSTDGGHTSPAIVDGSWMMGRPELWDDFGYRAMHVMTKNAKLLITAYYGQAPKYSYYTGCSGGGQQGLAEAQRYPADYNGIAVGAPANNPTRMWPGETWPSYVTHRTAANAIPVEKLAVLHQAAVDACDALDGVKDGLINNPRQCKFDPAVVQCKAGDAKDCLTAGQVDSAKLVYAGLKDPTTGEQFWPGYEAGSELDWPGHIGEPFVIPQGYFKAMVFNNPKWDWKTFNFAGVKDFQILYDADARYAPILDATDPDLTAFKALGGKLILWHGWADQNIAPQNSINYYNSVVTDQGTEAATQEFMRLFLAPGMGHCSGGLGPNTFDTLAPLAQWVEKGTAPAQIIASHLTNGVADRTRPLCVYPQVATYKGSGSSDEAANFECAAPK